MEPSNSATAEAEAPEQELPVGGPNDGAEENSSSAKLRESNEVLECVRASASTITGCSDNQLKNYLATVDFVCREVSVQLADMWKGICKAADKAGEDDRAAKVSVAIKVDINQTNILIMDTRVTSSYAEKHKASGELQEDLRQFNLDLPA